ncbi:hypothetical protein HNQ94_002539 [Salirhabdus euzebyi]|uniref:Uncharacterized protein n=1 Tax=Salirhabdus euzebyi TaxID=394506 RepID=A0A841Q6Q8_9BACI|nr:hypothetical protein [Salirhabdus euzebyi]
MALFFDREEINLLKDFYRIVIEPTFEFSMETYLRRYIRYRKEVYSAILL